MKFLFVIVLSFVFQTAFAQVGIGTTSPITDLHVVDSADSEVRVTSEAGISRLIIDAQTLPYLEMFSADEKKATFEWQSDQLKIFSAPPDTNYILGNPVLIRNPTLNLSEDKYVGINMGFLLAPSEALDVNGRIKLRSGIGPASAGTMRYNDTLSIFQGYDGTSWTAFGGASVVDGDADTYLQLAESATDSVKFIANTDGVMAFDGHRLTLGKNGNTFLGHEVTLADLMGNVGNTNLGWLNSYSMESGVSNTNVGFWTAHAAVGGDWNTNIGAFAGYKNKDGSSNTALGYRTGYNGNGSGNVFIGYRAGENEEGNDKLYIHNSETSDPLIHGDFDEQWLRFNGATSVLGLFAASQSAFFQDNVNISGNVSVDGNSIVDGSTTTGDIIITDNSPFLDFRQNGSSQYYLQYNNVDDRFDIAESATGTLIRLKDGEVYFPELAGSEAQLKVDATGKLTKVVEPPAVYRGHALQMINGEANYLLSDDLTFLVMDPVFDNGVTLASMTVTGQQNTSILNLPLIATLVRYNRETFASQTVFRIDIDGDDLPSGSTDFTTTTVVTAGSNEIDLDTYIYVFGVLENLAPNFEHVVFNE